MTDVIARIKLNGKHFEILVDADTALEFKRTQQGDMNSILRVDSIFSDSKKGLHASQEDIKGAFNTTDINEIAKTIILKGEVQVPAEHREKARGEKFKQIVDFLVRNAKNPQNDMPYTADRIERALEEKGVNITNKPIEAQIKSILSELSTVLPIRIETKKLSITIPSQYAGKIYGLLQIYKESEEWMSNGDLKVIVEIPVGSQMDFYDKLNDLTHGSAVSEELTVEQ